MRKGEIELLLDRSSRMTLKICRRFRKNCAVQRVANVREELRGKDKYVVGLNEIRIPQYFMDTYKRVLKDADQTGHCTK